VCLRSFNNVQPGQVVDIDSNSEIESPDSHSDESTGGLVVIALLTLVVGCLLMTCGLLWAEYHDVRLRVEIDARMKVVEAQEKAARALQEAKILRDQNESLRAALEAVKTHGSPNHPVHRTALRP